MFLYFFNYLKTETRKNSEKNYTNVSLDGRYSSIFRKNFKSKFNNKKKKKKIQTNWFFEKSKKIHSDSPNYYANLRYIIKVRNRKLREIWMFLYSDMREITIFDWRRRAQLPLMLHHCLLSREHYYQTVMRSDYLLFYDRFILIKYEYCNEFYDHIRPYRDDLNWKLIFLQPLSSGNTLAWPCRDAIRC